MKWEEEGLILSVRPFSEKGSVACLMTPSHGRCLGWVRGSSSPQARAFLQPGALVQAWWHARLEEQLGNWRLEPQGKSLACLFSKPLALSALLSATALAETFLPEREPQPSLYTALKALLETLTQETWLGAYFDFECHLLGVAGFRLDLSTCAATGGCEDLFYVSPRSGKAVSQGAGLAYHERLLRMPDFLKEKRPPTPRDLLIGLDLTEYFMERYILPHGIGSQGHGVLPSARARFKDHLGTTQKEI